MNTNSETLSDMAYYYPFMGMFTNNPNDIRSLEFIRHYDTNNHTAFLNNNNLKKEYYDLFVDANNHLNKLEDMITKDEIQDYYFRKWFYDFIYVPGDELFVFPTKETYEKLHGYLHEYIIDDIDIFDTKEDEEVKIKLQELIALFKENIKDLLIKIGVNGYITRTGYIDNHPYDVIFENIVVIPSLETNFHNKSIKSMNKNQSDLIIQINELLNNKYLHLSDLKGEISDSDLDSDSEYELNNITLSHSEEECNHTYLNIDKNICIIRLNEVFIENGYGVKSKAFFRNDNNFRIFDDLHHINIKNISKDFEYILDKLNFKFKTKTINILEPIYKIFISTEGEIITYEVDRPNNIITLTNNDTDNNQFQDYNVNDTFHLIVDIYNIGTIILKEKISNNKVLFEFINVDHILDHRLKSKVNIHLSKIDDILIPKGNFDLKYYESVASWKKHQTIDRTLNDKPYLLEYLNLYITTINKKIVYLNPIFKEVIAPHPSYIINHFIENINKMTLIPYNKNYQNNLSKTSQNMETIYKNILNLFIDKEIEQEEYLKILRELLPIKSKTTQQIIEYNFLNKIGILNNYLNKSNKKNLNILLGILNLSSKFDKKIINLLQ